MATNAERTKAICDALLNSVATQAQQLEVAEALFTYGPGLEPFASLTLQEKAAIIPRELRLYVMNRIRQLRESKRPPVADPGTDFPEA
jgi:hypothetical protein